jgi:hypothetical protein
MRRIPRQKLRVSDHRPGERRASDRRRGHWPANGVAHTQFLTPSTAAFAVRARFIFKIFHRKQP